MEGQLCRTHSLKKWCSSYLFLALFDSQPQSLCTRHSSSCQDCCLWNINRNWNNDDYKGHGAALPSAPTIDHRPAQQPTRGTSEDLPGRAPYPRGGQTPQGGSNRPPPARTPQSGSRRLPRGRGAGGAGWLPGAVPSLRREEPPI